MLIVSVQPIRKKSDLEHIQLPDLEKLPSLTVQLPESPFLFFFIHNICVAAPFKTLEPGIMAYRSVPA